MKKKLSFLFASLLIIPLAGCATPEKPRTLMDDVIDFYNESQTFDPKTHAQYDKDEDYGIFRELSTDEKLEFMNKAIVECPKSINRYDNGRYCHNAIVDNTGGTITYGDTYWGSCRNIYTNAVESYYLDSFSSYSTPGIPNLYCYMQENEHLYDYVWASLHPNGVRINGYEQRYFRKVDSFLPEYYLDVFRYGVDRHFSDEISRLQDPCFKGYEARNVYIFTYFSSVEEQEYINEEYSYREISFFFNKKFQLVKYIEYYEFTEFGRTMTNFYGGAETALVYSLYDYDSSGTRPTKDLSLVEEALERDDYLYIKHPSVRMAQISDCDTINTLTDLDFATDVWVDNYYSYSYFISTFQARFDVKIPYVDSRNNEFNAILGIFNFTFKGRLNGKRFEKEYWVRLSEKEDSYGIEYQNQEETGVIAVPYETLHSSERDCYYSFNIDFTISEDDIIFIENQNYYSGNLDL